MNKQEIIQQFVQQMQEPTNEQYQRNLAALSDEIETLRKRASTILTTYELKSVYNLCKCQAGWRECVWRQYK